MDAKDEKPLLAPRIKRHEHVSAGCLLHAAQLAATVAGDPAFAICGDAYLCDVIAARNVAYCDAPTTLLQEPLDKLPAPAPLLQRARDESAVAHILQDGARRQLQLFPRRPILTESIADLLVAEKQSVRVEAFLVRRLFPEAPGERARALGLNAAHDLQLRAAARARRAEYCKLFCAAATTAATLVRLAHEEHKRPPLVLQSTERRAPVARDVANAVGGDVNHRAIFAGFPTFDIDWAFQLLKQPFHVLLRALALDLGASAKGHHTHVLHDGSRRPLEFPSGAALLT
mmetsp:Transcript_97505/g.275833  ORF Transcript_97505/g.275833 Transcript_97505/m.275833 type:complete len:287 (-) Transcript_97505:832-1692(-)